MERAEALHRPARAAQRDVGTNYFLDTCPIAYGGDVFVIDPPAHGRESMFRPRRRGVLIRKSTDWPGYGTWNANPSLGAARVCMGFWRSAQVATHAERMQGT
jgi:hypothetical protein